MGIKLGQTKVSASIKNKRQSYLVGFMKTKE